MLTSFSSLRDSISCDVTWSPWITDIINYVTDWWKQGRIQEMATVSNVMFNSFVYRFTLRKSDQRMSEELRSTSYSVTFKLWTRFTWYWTVTRTGSLSFLSFSLSGNNVSCLNLWDYSLESWGLRISFLLIKIPSKTNRIKKPVTRLLTQDRTDDKEEGKEEEKEEMKDEEKMEGGGDERWREEEGGGGGGGGDGAGFLFNPFIRHLRWIKKPPAHQQSGYSQFSEAS